MENERANVRIRASEDRISALPDVLIHRIFSFLDAKFAVQSSVLSTRWERIWPSLPYLNFHRDNYRSVTRCTKFVTEFIANRDQGEGADISTFNLDLTGRTSLPFVVKIAEYAISRGVEQLSIAGSLPESHRPLPFSIFSSPYLKSLTLRIDLRVFGLSQKNWSLPALMTLNLGYMVFCEDGSKSAEPFSECVSLKSLSLICCKFSEGAKSLSLFKICSLPLSSLTISTEYPAHDRLPTKTLRWGLFSCEFMVSAPKLSSFNYGCCFPLALTIEDLHCLDKVNIHLSRVKDIAKANDSTKELVVSELLRTFQGLRNAKVVTLTTHIIEVLSFLPDLLEYQPCPFSVMKCLKLEVLHWSNTSTIPGHVMSYLLSSSPNATFVKEIEKVQRNRVFNKLDLLMNDGKPTNRWADPPALHPKFIKVLPSDDSPSESMNSSKTRNSSPNSPPPVETTVYISPGQVSVAGLSLADMQGPDQKIPMIEGSDLQSCPNEAHTSLKPPSLAQAKPAPPPKPAADLDSFFASLASFMESEELDSLAFSSHKSGGQGKYNPTSIQKAKSNLMQLLSLPLEALSRLGRTAELMDSINILLAGKCLSQDLAFKLRCLCKKLPAITKDFETAKKSSETAHSQIEARDASSKKIKECLSQYNSLKSSSTKLVDERKQNEELIEQIQARVSEIDSEALVIQAKMIQLADQAHVEEETYNAAKSEANLAAACIQRTEGEIARLEEAWAEFQDISKLV